MTTPESGAQHPERPVRPPMNEDPSAALGVLGGERAIPVEAAHAAACDALRILENDGDTITAERLVRDAVGWLRAALAGGSGEERQMNGAELIAAERDRQVSEEGWTPEHDDAHTHGELAKAAGVYAMPFNGSWKESEWPWEPESLRFHHGGGNGGRVRELVKAGALLAAEIDRLQRLSVVREGDRQETKGENDGRD